MSNPNSPFPASSSVPNIAPRSPAGLSVAFTLDGQTADQLRERMGHISKQCPGFAADDVCRILAIEFAIASPESVEKWLIARGKNYVSPGTLWQAVADAGRTAERSALEPEIALAAAVRKVVAKADR